MARLSTGNLARVSSRHPWLTIGIWVVMFFAAGTMIALFMSDATTTEFAFSNDPESVTGFELIEERFDHGQVISEVVVVRSDRYTVDDEEFQLYLMTLTGQIIGLGEDVIAEAVNYFVIPAEMGVPEEFFVSADRRTTIINVTMAGELDEAIDNIAELHEVTVEAEPPGGFEVFITGNATVSEDFNSAAEETLQQAEVFGVPIAFFVLAFIFVALVAASVPVIIATVAIVFAMAITAVVGQFWEDMSFFVINMITMMGLAVGIDYALFTISRYREERKGGLNKRDAIIKSGATASNAVFFSGMTVILALIGLLIVPMSLFQSLASGAIFVVSMAILVTLTLLPALLYLLGDRIDSPRLPLLKKMAVVLVSLAAITVVASLVTAGGDGVPTPLAIATGVSVFMLLLVLASMLAEWFRRRGELRGNGGFWEKESRLVMNHPVISLVIGAGILLALAVPSFDIETGQGKVEDLPHDLVGVEGTLVLMEDFPFAFTGEVQAVIDGDIASGDVQAAISRFQEMLEAEPETFGLIELEVNEAGDLATIEAPVPFDPASREATAIVERVRSEIVPAAFDGSGTDVYITGDIAFNLDYYDTTDTYRTPVIIFVLGLSFLLLMVVFRSLVVPVKAIIMNLLSVLASYGILVLVFQKGVGNELFGFNQVDTIDAWIPLFLFAILFGLSMDYHVFLLSRIRERYMETGDNAGSVAFGIQSTGGIITGAALIMVVIFGGFAAGDLVSFQQMGFGMAVAVLLDATIIRSIIVPASMRLLGERNWYLPRWLQWLPELHIEGSRED